MTAITDGYLAAAQAAIGLLGEPATARHWDAPSVLPSMPVSALAGHLARQIFSTAQLLAVDPGDEEPIGLLEHYARAAWVDAGLDDEPNMSVRRAGATEAAAGPDELAARAREVAAEVAVTLAGQPRGRIVLVPWGPWALTLDDFLVTRLMEISVHSDDLACSVEMPTPALPDHVTGAVVDLLSRLAVRRHGPLAVIRALSRAERAPATITAF